MRTAARGRRGDTQGEVVKGTPWGAYRPRGPEFNFRRESNCKILRYPTRMSDYRCQGWYTERREPPRRSFSSRREGPRTFAGIESDLWVGLYSRRRLYSYFRTSMPVEIVFMKVLALVERLGRAP